MQVSVETTSELSRKMTVQVPEEEVQAKIASRLKSLANRIRIDGFRPGKVPRLAEEALRTTSAGRGSFGPDPIEYGLFGREA